MALRTPLSVTPHLYMGDSTGRPLDMGTVYFGEQDKDPEFYPINLFSDDALTKPLAQPVHTKGGYLYDKGDMVEPHAKEIIYSVKVLDSYGRKVFYKGAMMRNSWNDDVIEQINTAIIESQGEAVIAAEKAVNDAINNTAVVGGILADTFVTATAKGVGAAARTQRDINSESVSTRDFLRLEGEADDTARFNRMIDFAHTNGIKYCDVFDGDYYIVSSNSDNSWFGWDSGINLKSGVHVRASKGAVIRSLPNGFEGGTLLRAKSAYDISWVGGRFVGDRDTHTGTAGEWGFNIAIYGCDRVLIDTQSDDAWGDGCFITSTQVNSGTPSTNVFLRLKANNNRRQGLSVSSCDGLYILQGTELTNTNGTAPSAGVDFEPDGNMTVKNVYIEHIICRGNAGTGFLAFSNATGSKIRNIQVGTIVTENNGADGFRARYSGIDGITVDRLVSTNNKGTAGLRMDGGVKNITIKRLESAGDIRGISLDNAVNPNIARAEVTNATLNSEFSNVIGGSIGNFIEDSANLVYGFALYNCQKVSAGYIETKASNSTGIYINGCNGCDIGYSVSGIKSGNAVHIRGSDNNIIKGVVGVQNLAAYGGYGVLVGTTSKGNVIHHNVVKKQGVNKLSAGVFCEPTTSGNSVKYNEVEAGASTLTVYDDGNNTFEFNSGQFVPDTLNVTAANLASKTHKSNTKYKIAGRIVLNTTDGLLYYASGENTTDTWRAVKDTALVVKPI